MVSLKDSITLILEDSFRGKIREDVMNYARVKRRFGAREKTERFPFKKVSPF